MSEQELAEYWKKLRAERNEERAAEEAERDAKRAVMDMTGALIRAGAGTPEDVAANAAAGDAVMDGLAQERQASWDGWHSARRDGRRLMVFSAPRAIRPLIRRARGATRRRRTAVTRSRSRSPGGESSDSSDSGSSDPPDVARRRAGTSSFPSGTPP